jgi:hypothetical protein
MNIWIPQKMYDYFPYVVCVIGIILLPVQLIYSYTIYSLFGIILCLLLVTYGALIILARSEYKNGDY